MRVIVCGGRDFTDSRFIYGSLERLRQRCVIHGDHLTEIIHGDARGADRIAGEWANDPMHEPIKVTEMPADWETHGKAAGPIRNAAMLALKPDGVVAFPGGRGTADMVKQAKAAGVPVWEPKP